MIPAPWERRNVVYRVLNRHGRCVYVGCTRSLPTRIYDHRLHAHWGWEIERVRLTIHATREEALAHEMSEIRRLRPRYNINGRGRRFEWNAVDFVEVLEESYRRIDTGTDQRSGTGSSPYNLSDIRRHFALMYPEIALLVAAQRSAEAVA